MSFSFPVTTQQPVIVEQVKLPWRRKLVSYRFSPVGANYQNIRINVPAGKLWVLDSAYIQIDATAGGATVRQAMVGYWSTERSSFGAETDINTYASTSFSDNVNHLLMFSKCSGHALRTTGTYRTENVPIPDMVLRNGDFIRVDMYELTATDILTAVFSINECEE